MPKKFIKGATIGALIGAAAALLLAPKSGKHMREDIKKIAIDLSKKISEQVSKTASLTKDSYDKIVDTVVGEYRKNKEVADNDWDEIKITLKEKWNEVRDEMEREEDEI